MDQSNSGDRIERDAEVIAGAAADIEKQRAVELAAQGEEARIDAEMAELAHKRAAQEHARAGAHDAIVSDEKRIAEADRDLKEALAAGGSGGDHGGGDHGGDGHDGGSGSSGGPGPKNPPVVPPRRVG